jgi:hypothetical protein
MIKKLFLMSTGIVLGCMITTTSFARSPSSDCVDARNIHHEILEQVVECRDGIGVNCDLGELRECKRLSMTVARAVCPNSSYLRIEEIPVGIEEVDPAVCHLLVCTEIPEIPPTDKDASICGGGLWLVSCEGYKENNSFLDKYLSREECVAGLEEGKYTHCECHFGIDIVAEILN